MAKRAKRTGPGRPRKAAPTAKRPGPGRPRKDTTGRVDGTALGLGPELVFRAAALQLSYTDLSFLLGLDAPDSYNPIEGETVSGRTIARRVDEDKELKAAHAEGTARAHASLRRLLYLAAAQKQGRLLIMWAKQAVKDGGLGWRDKGDPETLGKEVWRWLSLKSDAELAALESGSEPKR